MAPNRATLTSNQPSDTTQINGQDLINVSSPSLSLLCTATLTSRSFSKYQLNISSNFLSLKHSRLTFSLNNIFSCDFVIEEKKMQEQATSSIPANSLPSSSERSSSSALHHEVKEGMESDDEIRRVPEIGSELAGPTTSGRDAGSAGPVQTSGGGSRRRGRSPADKENKRLKRLLRNRVSAQQARERKKAYMIDLEARVKELETKNAELEERVSTLQNENQMLRQILKNTTAAGSQEGRK